MVDMTLAIAKAYCDRCHDDEWLYLNDSEDYGLLCAECMKEIGASPREAK